MAAIAIAVGSEAELRKAGQLVGKVGHRPVLVVWHDDRAYAIDDRCPHLGFPLHQGSVEAGLVTCHWHHARFDLSSGCTLDPWADDAEGYDVELRNGEVWVSPRPPADRIEHLQRRLRQGLEDRLTLVIAKATLGLLEAGAPAADLVRTGLSFGLANRAGGWGSGLTVLVAMANVLPYLDEADRPLALVHGLGFVARDSANQPPRFVPDGLVGSEASEDRLVDWYRRFVDGRNAAGAERAFLTLVRGAGPARAGDALVAAATDHVFIDEGHTIDFINKAYEALVLLDGAAQPSPADVLSSVVGQMAGATRAEEMMEWRHPVDLTELSDAACARLESALTAGAGAAPWTDEQVSDLAWSLLGEDPAAIARAVPDALARGATPEQVARAVALAAGLRITRFHNRNDHGDWDQVHHAFTTANAVHQAIARRATPELIRGVVHGALRVYLDRFLNIPAAPVPSATSGSLDDLATCWEIQGAVDAAGAAVYGFLAGGGRRQEVVAALGHALLSEDAEFHWYQVFEAATRQAFAWPEGSEESALLLVGLARFLSAHTPTRRELARVVDIARRLRRGEALYEDA